MIHGLLRSIGLGENDYIHSERKFFTLSIPAGSKVRLPRESGGNHFHIRHKFSYLVKVSLPLTLKVIACRETKGTNPRCFPQDAPISGISTL